MKNLRKVLVTFFMLVSVVAEATPTERESAAGPKNFIFFGRERHRIAEPGFLGNPVIVGAQLKYTWRELEPECDRYEFQQLFDDLTFLERHGKRLFVQVQDGSFSEDIPVPEYLLTDPAFSGGVARKYDYEGDDEAMAQFDGWNEAAATSRRTWPP